MQSDRASHDIDWLTFTVAQDGGVGLPGSEAASGAPLGTPGANGGGAPPGAGGLGSLFPILLGLMVVMLFVSMIGPRREKKKREAMLSQIKKHDRVQTVGGVIGAIVELKPDTVVLKVDESANTRITFARSAIQQVLTVTDERVSDEKDASKSA